MKTIILIFLVILTSCSPLITDEFSSKEYKEVLKEQKKFENKHPITPKMVFVGTITIFIVASATKHELERKENKP